MNIIVRYMTQFRQASGVVSEQLMVNDDTIAGLLRVIADRHDAARRLLFTAAGSVQPTVLVFIRDEQADVARAILKDGDEVTLLAPIAGG